MKEHFSIHDKTWRSISVCLVHAWYNNRFLPIWFESGFESIQPNDFFFTLAWTPISISINQDLKTYLFSALSETLTVLSLVPSNLAYCNFVEYGSSEKPTRKVLMLLLFEDATGNFLASSRKLSLAYSYYLLVVYSCIFQNLRWIPSLLQCLFGNHWNFATL